MTKTPTPLPASIDGTLDLLSRPIISPPVARDRAVSRPQDGRPLFLRSEAGVGKTEIAKVLSATLGRG